MRAGEDLAAESLAAVVGDRELQSHPVLLSAAVTAAEWTRAGAPDRAVVVVHHQIAPRGHGGKSWKVTPGEGLAFALVVRPKLASDREGWLFTVALAALTDACGDGTTVEWPDEIHRDGALAAAVSMDVRLGGLTIRSAVLNVLVAEAQPPRGALLGSVLDAIDARLAGSPEEVLADYVPRCATIGRAVRVRLLGGTTRLQGTAVEVTAAGALVLELDGGSRVPVRPQDVSTIETL